MNLTTEPWIPVADAQGQARQVSLRQVFADGSALQDLAVRPHERVALMRLLICIAQAALEGPPDPEALEACGRKLPAAVAHYFGKWQDCFDLFHPEKPFLQFQTLARPQKAAKKTARQAMTAPDEQNGGDDGTAASKLDFALATGSNTTLFDHRAASGTVRVFEPSQLALMLVTFQCFSPSGRIGVARWRDSDTPGNGSSGHAPCAPSAMLHAFVRRGNLLDSIHANLLSQWAVKKNYRHDWGRPVWEQMPQSFSDAPAITNATTTYLGRLMPLARAILLRPDGKGLLLANGLDYPTPPGFPAEPSASVAKKRDESGYVLVGAGNKAIWRELPAVVVKRLADDGAGGPLVLGDLTDASPLDLWVGALITDKASILDTVEGVYKVPARMLNDAGRRAYEDEVKESESMAFKLGNACKTYRQHLVLKPQGYPEQSLALRRYWASIEQRLPLLHAYLNAPDATDQSRTALAQWRSALWSTARDTFNASCANETPRQLRAHALALRSLQRSQRGPTENLQPKTQNR
jgi:CRISPR system Cascade subunit CasA